MGELEAAVERVQRGDSAAFRAVVRLTEVSLLRLAARIMGDRAEGEDVLQEAYFRAYRALSEGKFEGSAKVTTWLYRVVTHAAIDALRTRKRRPLPTDTLPERPFEGGPAAEAHVALKELDGWLAILPPDQRTAIVLHALEGFGAREIAEITGSTEGAVEQRLVRARATLRRQRDKDHE